ncbi:MAG: site-specific DNA-methyltransferase [Candidatus Pacebacteria bacterium]|nr:site-specific DNA-methyltransferase [Candidatus Paceibacterota bacterium]
MATKDSCFIEHKWGRAGDVQITYGDAGGASRFFYCAKACPKEKGSYNNHPTVKPLKLIKYLVRLVTPVNGISLDPFAGSGTHALACIEQGINYIGFEKERKYYDICLKRITDSHFSKTKGESNALR